MCVFESLNVKIAVNSVITLKRENISILFKARQKEKTTKPASTQHWPFVHGDSLCVHHKVTNFGHLGHVAGAWVQHCRLLNPVDSVTALVTVMLLKPAACLALLLLSWLLSLFGLNGQGLSAVLVTLGGWRLAVGSGGGSSRGDGAWASWVRAAWSRAQRLRELL